MFRFNDIWKNYILNLSTHKITPQNTFSCQNFGAENSNIIICINDLFRNYFWYFSEKEVKLPEVTPAASVPESEGPTLQSLAKSKYTRYTFFVKIIHKSLYEFLN